jgi:thiopeptide-type bacteriocin biosynthesis protein
VTKVLPGGPSSRRSGAGGEWLYLKVYGSRRDQDELLRDHVPPLVRLARDHGADRWFFIRYSDHEGQHLRLRWHGEPDALWGKVLPGLGARLRQLQDQRVAGHYVIDEYDPELERYGGPDALTAAERVFEADSETAIALLELVRRPGFQFDLDALAAISVASLCHGFGQPSAGAHWLPDNMGDDPAFAWLSTTGTRRDLPASFRKQAQFWRGLINPAEGWPELSGTEDGRLVLAALSPRDLATADYGQVIRDLVAAGRCSAPEVRIVGSLLHMTCNRVFGGYQERETRALAIARGSVQDNHERMRRT